MIIKIDNIFSMILFDKDHYPIWAYDPEVVTIELDEDVKIYGITEIGRSVTVTSNMKNGNSIEIMGRYAGEVNESN